MRKKAFITLLLLSFFFVLGVFINKYFLYGKAVADSSCDGNTTMTDLRDGKVYNIVQIGTQCWMAENLNVGTRIDGEGSSEPINQRNDQFPGQIEKYCWNDNLSNCALYGGYYQWHEAMNLPQACDNDNGCFSQINYPHQGICPSGWHIPSDVEDAGNPTLNNDWYILENYLKNSGQNCSATRDDAWSCNNAGSKMKTGGTSGFEAKLTGSMGYDGDWMDMGADAHFWTSSRIAYNGSESDPQRRAWGRDIDSGKNTIARKGKHKNRGFPVRCVKDPTPPTPTNTPTPTPTPTYTVSGNVFNDIDKDRLKDGGEINYPAVPNISINPAVGTVNALPDGSYTISNLLAGTYIINYGFLPSGYIMVWPKPPNFQVTVGPGCSIVDTSTGGSCVGDNVIDLNFSISNSMPWMQTYGLDLRMDDGFKNFQPANTSCGGGSYASGVSGSLSSPGVVFSGDMDADFGQGSSSSMNWVVGSMSYPEVYQSATSLKTSTQNLVTSALRAGVTIVPLASIGSCSDPSVSCNLQPLARGFYYTAGDINIDQNVNFNNGNYIIVSGGTIRFTSNKRIRVGTDSTVIFSARDIRIDSTIGGAPVCDPLPTGQLQGLFSADNDIIVEGNDGICTGGPDKMLNIEGSIIANASQGSGSFKRNRDLCGFNPTYPSITIKARPDFILHNPGFLTEQNDVTFEESP